MRVKRCSSLAFAVPSSTLPLRTKVFRCLFLKDTYRFARSYQKNVVRRLRQSGRTPLMGFIGCSPPPTQALRVHFARPKPWSARSCQAPHAFRPCRFSRLRRFSPRCTLRVCCASLPVMGFAPFPGPVPKHVALSLERHTLRSISLFSSLTSSPGFPLFTSDRALSPLCLHRPAAPRFRQASLCTSPRPQGFAPLKSPLRRTNVAAGPRPMLPWAYGLIWQDRRADRMLPSES
jgi:hypothetical protein